MKDAGKDIPRGLVAHGHEKHDPRITNIPPERWRNPPFVPLADGSGNDRFGNRIHYSPDFAYTDRDDQVVRAGLLLSPEGQALIRDLPGCLSQLDSAIKEVSEAGLSKVEFKHGMLLDMSMSGDQSKIYVWETTKGGKYTIKVPSVSFWDVLPSDRIDQPYIDEMLQTQEIAVALQPLSEAVNVGLSTFLFASSNVSCSKFEEGQHPENWTDGQRERVTTFAKNVGRYISNRRHSEDRLFDKITTDIGDRTLALPPKDNMIVGADGFITWIDPFIT